MITYRDEKRLVDYLLVRLEERLGGRHEREILKIQPSDHCQLGILAPWSEDQEVGDQPEEVSDEPLNYPVGTKPDARVIDPTKPTKETKVSEETSSVEPFSGREDAGRRPPSALGLAIAAQEESGNIELTVTASFAVYTRHFPDFEEQRSELGTNVPNDNGENGQRSVTLIDKFKRHTLKIPPIRFLLKPDEAATLDDNGIVQAVITEFIGGLRGDPSVLRQFQGNRVVPAVHLCNEAAYLQFLSSLVGPQELPPLRASLRLRARPATEGLRIEVYLCNDSPRDTLRPSNDQYRTLADAEVGLTVNRGRLVPVELLPVPQDYQYDRSVFALGRNAGVEVSANRLHVRTRALAQYEQSRMITHDRVVAEYRALAENPFDVLESIYKAMLDYAQDWRERIISGNSLDLNPSALEACRHDLAAFESEIDNFCAGIAAMAADDRLESAFRAMNRAFAKGRNPAWRLFQIVFIVSQLPSLVIREGIEEGEWPKGCKHHWGQVLEQADILWFPTGGGKTEAYMGLVACAALYDRLRSKLRGVTAWLRFPLRMLSVQQLQRAIRVLWAAEQERLALQDKYGDLGDPFALGYYVGSSNTPNKFNDAWSFDRLEGDEKRRERLLLVPDCPACGAEGAVEICLDRANQRVRHVCSHCHTELPVYVTDVEIYRFQPTLLVGTVDKMAAIGYEPKVATLWLGAEWRCPLPGHGYGNQDWCVHGCPTNPKVRNPNRIRRQPLRNYDPAPALHIQDELHLLQEELGAFSGHYETMARANERASAGCPSKIIAATATIAGYVHQARQIYGVREVRRFPNRGYDLSQSFYAMIDNDPHSADYTPKVARVFVGFRPPFLRPADAAARCAEILHETINTLQQDPVAGAQAIGLLDGCTADEVKALLAYYSRTLTYVGKRDSGVRIRQRLELDSSHPDSLLRPSGTRDLNVEYLSSHSTLKEIAAAVKRAEAPTPWSAEDHLDATVATHVISHGVDVEYFNLMVLERIPEEVGDYIQVASRSGRQHAGLVLSVLPRYSLRASSIYARFTEFHRHLDRMVSPVPVNRFAKAAVDRSFPGILLGSLYGRHLNILSGSKDQVLHAVAQAMSRNDGPLNSNSLHAALRNCYALDEKRYDGSLEEQMSVSLERNWQGFLFEVRHPSHHNLTEVFDPPPMSSLRDVDVPVAFRVNEDAIDWRDLRWFEQRQG